MKRLVIFTSHYPYGNGEPFLEEEIRIAETRFDEIMIVTFAKQNEPLTRYLPSDSRVIHLRRDSNKSSKLYEAFILIQNLFKPTTWRQLCHGIRERGFKQLFVMIKTILLNARHISYIKKNEGCWADSDSVQTVFYSYWLNAAAVYLAHHKNDLNGICICRAHGGDCFFDRDYVPWRKDVIEKTDQVFSISAGGKDDMILHYGKYIDNINDKISVARLGVDIPETINNASASDGIILVTCSNVIPLKRLDLLIHALADKSIRHHIKWVHFGDGPQFEEITRLANQYLNHSDFVTYEFKGRKSKEDIFTFYRENHVALFVNCSDVEGIPVSIMEAMSYGIPALARDVGCNRELVNDTCGALLPDKITSEDLAKCINNILSENDEAADRKRTAAIETVRKNYNCTDNYKMFFDHIEKMLQERVNE